MILIFKNKKIADRATEKTILVLQKKLSERNVQSDIVSFDDIELYIEKNDVKAFVAGEQLLKYSTIFFRRVGQHRNRAHIIALLAKKSGINFIDHLYGVTNEPGKLKQTAVLGLSGVSVPKTYFAGQYCQENIGRAIEFLGLPIVAKISVGKKGQGVYLANSKEELEKIALCNSEEEILLQEFIPNEFDYRILVLDGTAVCAEKRIRTDKDDFRNNVSLGAREEFVPLESVSKNILDLAIDAAKKADIQVAGVDIVLSPEGEAFVLEVNRAPAFTHGDAISNELNSLADFLCASEQKIS